MDFIAAPDIAPPGGHYSQAVRAGEFVYVSGILPVLADGTVDPAMTFEQQCHRVFDSLAAILAAAGCAFPDLVRCTCYIVGAGRWADLKRIYAERMGAHRPARTIVPVPELHFGFGIEVEAVAHPQAGPRSSRISSS